VTALTAPPTTIRPSMDLADWYPLLAKAGIPTPRTHIIKTNADLTLLFDGVLPDGFDDLVTGIQDAAADVGYPAFLRTGHGSGKHDWANTCFLRSPQDVPAHVAALVDWSYAVDLVGLPTDTWVVRELLPLRPAFVAFAGLPVTRERRYFINALGQVTGHHPYWPAAALAESNPRGRTGPLAPEAWQPLLADINVETDEEVAELTALTERVAAVVHGDWSVDWLYVEGRGWVCIDLAHFERSWIDFDHPTAPFTYARQTVAARARASALQVPAAPAPESHPRTEPLVLIADFGAESVSEVDLSAVQQGMFSPFEQDAEIPSVDPPTVEIAVVDPPTVEFSIVPTIASMPVAGQQYGAARAA
jgi:hypothetical protein